MASLLCDSPAWALLSLLCLAIIRKDRHRTGSPFNGGEELWRQIRKFLQQSRSTALTGLLLMFSNWMKLLKMMHDSATSAGACVNSEHKASKCDSILNIYTFAHAQTHCVSFTLQAVYMDLSLVNCLCPLSTLNPALLLLISA